MRIYSTQRFLKSYRNASPYIQQAFKKQSMFLVGDIHHPSLHAKKYDESQNRWQARVTKNWRFYFRIEDDVYIMLDISKHPN